MKIDHVSLKVYVKKCITLCACRTYKTYIIFIHVSVTSVYNIINHKMLWSEGDTI